MAWLDEYKLTYSPSPPSSFALSLYGKKRRDTNPGVRERRGAQSGQTSSVNMWLRSRGGS